MTSATLSTLAWAANGVAREQCRPWQRRAFLRDLIAVAAAYRSVDDRVVRELARTLHSEATRASSCRRRGWLHSAVAGLALDLLRELAPRVEQARAQATVGPQLAATGRCAVCQAVIAASRAMCFRHWSQVPRWLQRQVVLTGDPALVDQAVHAVTLHSGKVRAWTPGKKPAEFRGRPARRRAA